MNLVEKMHVLNHLFGKLELTSSRNEKEALVAELPDECKEDLTFCFEVLAGQHKLGYKLLPDGAWEHPPVFGPAGEGSLKAFCFPLYEIADHSDQSIRQMRDYFKGYGWFLVPLFNREWRLGINKSQLDTTIITPMLAKKFDPDKFPKDEAYYITEKLDGNRCIAVYDEDTGKWFFYSRSGKKHKASFDMSGFDKSLVYDGEIMSRKQRENPSQENFNSLSGALNSIDGDKSDLVYIIFDVVEPFVYHERRNLLESASFGSTSNNVSTLPIIAVASKENLVTVVQEKLDAITDKGGEGVMINLGSRHYEHRRTDSLLKVKKTYTMDMMVVDTIPGTGKNEGLVGSLLCNVEGGYTSETYWCQVGSGLSDAQRATWAAHPEQILNKIVEVAYFSVSQDKTSRGTSFYSLRFPRLKRVRDDKDTTSVD